MSETNKKQTGQPLAFGALAPLLSEQLQWYSVPDETVKHFQMDNDAISRLRIRGLIPDSIADKAYDRLAKNIVKSIRDGEAKNGGKS